MLGPSDEFVGEDLKPSLFIDKTSAKSQGDIKEKTNIDQCVQDFIEGVLFRVKSDINWN